MASAEGTDSIELDSFSSKNRDIHSSTLKSASGAEDGESKNFIKNYRISRASINWRNIVIHSKCVN